MDLRRYSRQTIFGGIGEEGQRLLLQSRVVVIGLGALGTVIAGNLARAGVGFIRLVDRDYVELTNLQRQTLFNEQDAADELPKAIAAYNHLSKVNSEIELEPVVADVTSANIEPLIGDTDLVLDGSDNVEIRYLINEACHKHKIPWIYGGALASTGMTMNFLYDDGPCFRCFLPVIPAPGSAPTCSTFGVLNMITGIIASVESAEALKILVRSPKVRRTMFYINIWNSSSDSFEVARNLNCPVCAHGSYEFLGKISRVQTTSLCGRDSIQVVPGGAVSLDFPLLAEKLSKIGTVNHNKFMLSFNDQKVSFNLFADGRAIIKNVRDEAVAKSVYSEYIGL